MLRVLVLTLLLASCSTGKPSKPGIISDINYHDACDIYANRPQWQEASLEASRRWQVPIFMFLAIVYQESSFNAEARPVNSSGKRLSTAYGYAQALDGTWREYMDESGNSSGKRNRFADAVDFIGWYVLRVHRATGISKWDARRQYLNYHEGIGGYKRGLHRNKPWLLRVANKVRTRANRYHKQLLQCKIPIYLEQDGSIPDRYKKRGVSDESRSKRIHWN